MPPFVAVDGIFLKAKVVQTLLLAGGIDANGHTLIHAWAVVESENTESWTQFFERLKCAIAQVLDITLISDRNKELLAADHILGDHVTRLPWGFPLIKTCTTFEILIIYFGD